MPITTRISERVAEGSTARVTGSFVDLDGEAFKPEQVLMTLYNVSTGEIINNRSDVDVTSYVDDSGNLSLELTPDDNPILHKSREESRILLLEWTWDSGLKAGKHEIHFVVRDLAFVQ